MITEHELERVLVLRDKIKELRIFISKLESCKVSSTSSMNSKIMIDSNTIDVDEYTVATLKRFHSEIINDYRHKLEELESEYNSIIYSTEEAFERVLREQEDGDKKNKKKR